MREIVISNFDHPLLVDDEDFPVLNRFPWSFDRYPQTSLASGCRLRCHEILLPRTRENVRFVVDHINGFTWDNQKNNLRWATKSQNGQNRKKEFIGVHYCKRRKKYRAYHTISGVWRSLGYHATFEDAARAYDAYVRENRTGHVKLNLPA